MENEELCGSGDSNILQNRSCGVGALDNELIIQPVTSSQEEQKSENDYSEHLDKIQRNELIAEKIAEYLTIADMKAVSEVSTGFNQMIRSTQAFREKAMLLICKETVLISNFLVDSTFPWKLAQIDLSIDNSLIDIISDILQTVHTLQLKLERTDNVDAKAIVDFLIAIITNTPNLTSLKLESGIMERVLHDVFSEVQVQSRLSNLKSLEICSGICKGDATHYIDDQEGDEEGPFPRNFLQLSLLPLQLQRFRLAKIDTLSGSETRHVKFIPNIVEANYETLKELSLHLNVWKLEGMKSIRCPHLKSLELTADESSAACVFSFINNQPLLDKLDIEIRGEFPPSVLSAIEGRCSKLKKLHITAKMFSGLGLGNPVNWQFIGRMDHLRDFSINRPNSIQQRVVDFGTGAVFLNVLPSHVKKVHIRGLDMFWHDPTTESDIQVQERISIINRFRNVTYLSFMRCDGCLNDEIIQNIFREFGQLLVLEVSHCSEFTDAGLTGIQTDGGSTGISIKNLTGLTELKIRACPSISHEGILQAVALPYLRSIDYLTVLAVTKQFMLTIVGQNPSLECLSVFVSDLDCVTELKGELKKVNPRLWRFLNLNDNNWVEEDSESDADQNQWGWDDNDSNISGGGYHAHVMYDNIDSFSDDAYSDDYDESDGFDD